MKAEEIRNLSTEDLAEQVASAEKKLQGLKFSHAVSPIENPLQIKGLRRDVARLKTELHARKLEVVKEKVVAGELTLENAHEYLQKNNVPEITLAKVKKVIGKYGA